MSQIVLSLYGALPLPADVNPQRNLGQISAYAYGNSKASKTLVLGWNFEPSIGETITALNDSRLEVLVIPPDLMDRLKKKGGIDKLRG